MPGAWRARPSAAKAGEEILGPFVVRRGIGGRLRVMAAGRRWWSARTDALFLGWLAATGNVAVSARAAGFTPKTAWNQRRARPGFARAWDAAIEDAEIELEFRLLVEAGDPDRIPARIEPERPVEPGTGEEGRFDHEQAMRLLTLRHGRRTGRTQAPRAKPPDREAVAARIERGVRAIRRHKARFGARLGD